MSALEPGANSLPDRIYTAESLLAPRKRVDEQLGMKGFRYLRCAPKALIRIGLIAADRYFDGTQRSLK
jgi:hypothetical protein